MQFFVASLPTPAASGAAGPFFQRGARQLLPHGNGRKPLPLDPALERLVDGAGGSPPAGDFAAGPNPPAAGDRPARELATPPSQGREYELLARQHALVEQWLQQADTPQRLAERGLRLDDVQAQVALVEDGIRRDLARWRREGLVTYTLVPDAHHIFSTAVRNTEPRPGEQVHAAATASTAATPTGTAAAGAASAAPVGQAGPAALERRAAALARLQSFEAEAEQRIVQFRRGDAGELHGLAQGRVRFLSEDDLIHTVPCAEKLTLVPPLFGSRYSALRVALSAYRPTYPAPAGKLALTEATHGHWPVLVARGGDDTAGPRHQVRISRDQRQWLATDVYTDEVVEAAKLQMWDRILGKAKSRAPGSGWRSWLGW